MIDMDLLVIEIGLKRIPLRRGSRGTLWWCFAEMTSPSRSLRRTCLGVAAGVELVLRDPWIDVASSPLPLPIPPTEGYRNTLDLASFFLCGSLPTRDARPSAGVAVPV